MNLIVEDGSGVFNANSYVGPAFTTYYLYLRNRLAGWSDVDRRVQEAALIAATDYVENRFRNRFLGSKEHIDLTVAASNSLIFYANPSIGDTVTIDSVVYTFRSAATVANEVTVGATISDSVDALCRAVLGTGGGNGTTAHPTVSADVRLGSPVLFVQALAAGILAAPIPTLSSNPELVWDTPILTGGRVNVSQPLEFPRIYLYDKVGNSVSGIPEALKEAVSEYASRAVTSLLMPDPEVDPTGQSVSLVLEKIGPIETQVSYLTGSAKDVFQRYPAADKLLSPFLMSGGQVFR